ncbi:DNA primase [hydrothermal vent metagenome]|uniref:DNA primase n=1 Tax=hydrothermal vent metagenome TaxID=652676 RepID=A0A1W1BVK7_9ZZZZ
MIDNTSIEALKNSIDIVDVVGNYIELKKAGANYKANCPFHGEKTPSFVVSPSKQIYHCFGCGVGGDSVKFVMEIEKLNYPEAIEKLASTYNFSLQYTKGESDYSEIKRVLGSIQKWYVKNLDLNEYAKRYLQDRGISSSSIEAFEIGYVGKSGEVIDFLNRNLLPLPKAQDAGILATGESGEFYARLVERVIFPIYSSNGVIVGFGGRTLSNHPAKYINSPQTKLFNKSRILYGYNRAKDHIYSSKRLIVCEGYLDVIMLHQAGFREAVATLGTALTTEHLPLLRKGDPKIVLAYDGDKAGVAAALKAAQMLSASGFDGGVVLFPNGQDPADMIAHGDVQTVAKLLREPKPLISFVIEALADNHNLSDPREKEVAFGEVRSFLSSLSPIMQDAYIPIAASCLQLSPSLFSKGANLSQVRQDFNQRREDIEQLSIFKTLMEKPSLIDDLLNVVDTSMFVENQEMFEAILRGDETHPLLVGLSIDNTIMAMEEDEFKKSLLWMLTKYYTTHYRSIAKDPNLSYQKKSFLMRKIKMDILPRLKRGELVAYEKLS